MLFFGEVLFIQSSLYPIWAAAARLGLSMGYLKDPIVYPQFFPIEMAMDIGRISYFWTITLLDHSGINL